MIDYFKLMRVKHYLKNVLIFVPLFFSGLFFNKNKLLLGVAGFFAYSFVCSSVYILNDLKDINKDSKHPTKRNRPLASGRVSPKNAIVLLVTCVGVSILLSLLIGNVYAALLLYLYFILNIAYSLGLKNQPIIDIVILASGFVIRVFYGGLVTNITISKWLYLVVTTGSLYMGLGKRRNELKALSGTRDVLKFYNESFLDKNMYVCVALTIVFYALWTLELSNPIISWTIPFFIIILLRYSLDIEGNSDGDPIEVILKDKMLIGLTLMYGISIFIMLYFQ